MPPDDDDWAAAIRAAAPVAEDTWTVRNAARLRRALTDPAVQAALLALLGHDEDQAQARRAEAARRELDGLALHLRLAYLERGPDDA